MEIDPPSPDRRIYTVTELTRAIKALLESKYPLIWVAAEISNLHRPASGHFYFTLKDRGAQIGGVMFRAQNRGLRFEPEDGMAVVVMGRLNVYEPRGAYQVIVEYMEPKGVGVLQLAFEQLKAQLEEEGLFREEYKRPLPFLPSTVAVVTSPTGAVIRDIITVLYRRYPNVVLEVAPVRVQGEGAAEEIVQAIDIINKRAKAEVMILARGGGSLEDLQAFNTEPLARAVFESDIPIVSAVGHETDFTIADFVADMRAPTPSAAAEMVVPVKGDLVRLVDGLKGALKSAMSRRLEALIERLLQASTRLVHPGRQVSDYRLRLDDSLGRAVRAFSRHLGTMEGQLDTLRQRLARSSPVSLVEELKLTLEHCNETLYSSLRLCLQVKASALQTVAAKLGALNPLGILERGYSVTRTLPDYAVVSDARQVSVGDEVEVRLWKGSLECRIERKKEDA